MTGMPVVCTFNRACNSAAVRSDTRSAVIMAWTGSLTGSRPASNPRAAAPLALVRQRMPNRSRWPPRTRQVVVLSSTTRTVVSASHSDSMAGKDGSADDRRNSAVNQKVLPFPVWLSTPISPPINSTSCLLMVVPRPVPPYCRVVELSAWVKLEKTWSIFSSGIPIPVSFMKNRIRACSPLLFSGLASMRISPSWVNLTAFPVRLNSI